MSRPVRVTGMTGAGNDFILIGPDSGLEADTDLAGWVGRVTRRGLSIGADGVLFVDPAGADRIRVRYFNPDGSRAFCGNGSRCAARFAQLTGLAGSSMLLLTDAGEIPAEVSESGVRLRLPAPEIHGERSVEFGDGELSGLFVHAGIPHFVLFVEDPAETPLSIWGPALRRHPIFGAAGTNVNVAALRGSRLVLRTWERGVEAETLCCGSGAVAAAFAARQRGAAERIEVVPASGIALHVELPGEVSRPSYAFLEGEARLLFRGEIDPEAWEWPG